MLLDVSDDNVWQNKWVVTEDYRIELYDKMPSSNQKDQKLSDTALCFRCLHTSTHTSSPFTLEADDIDKVEHDIGKHKKFPPGFNITIEFEEVPTAQQWVSRRRSSHFQRIFFLLPSFFSFLSLPHIVHIPYHPH